MSDEHLHPVGPDNPGYDPAEPNSRGLVVFLILTVFILIGVFVGVSAFWDVAFEHQEQEVLLGKPSEDLAALHAREDLQLKTYGYINKDKGIVQIPIDRALELVAREAAEGKSKFPTVATPVKKDQPVAAAAPAPAAEKK